MPDATVKILGRLGFTGTNLTLRKHKDTHLVAPHLHLSLDLYDKTYPELARRDLGSSSRRK